MAKTPKQLQITTMEYSDFISRYDGNYPAKFMFVCGLGLYNFIHTSKRSIAEQFVKDNYDGRYGIREI